MAMLSLCLQGQPSNDLCGNAILLAVDGSCNTFSNAFATPSNNPEARPLCGFGVADFNDVWFTAIIPASGNLTIETNSASNNLIEAYKGSCNNLQAIACSSNRLVIPSNESDGRIQLENQIAGSTIYIKVFDTQSGSPGIFDICLKDEGRTVYTCRIDLIDIGVQSACDPLTNSFSQDFTVHYYTDGSVIELYLLGEYFPLTSSPMTVTVTDIAANGNTIDILAGFDFPLFDYCGANSRYPFFDALIALPNCAANPPINDECATALELGVTQNGCSPEAFDITGASPSSDSSNCSENVQDIWTFVIIPNSGEVIIAIDENSEVADPRVELYEGTCGNLTSIGCGNEFTPIRLIGQTPGDQLYMRLYAEGSREQGNINLCAIDPVPQGDNCSNATLLKLSSTCLNLGTHSTHFANADGVPSQFITCGDQEFEPEDVWLSAVVPQSGELNLSISPLSNLRSPGFYAAEIFSGGCNNLLLIDCQENIFNGPPVEFDLLNRVPGETIYVRIAMKYFYQEMVFQVCASSACPDTEIVSSPIQGVYDLEADISVTGNDLILINSNVTFDAGMMISLDPGFEVEAGAVFHAFIDGCGGQ